MEKSIKKIIAYSNSKLNMLKSFNSWFEFVQNKKKLKRLIIIMRNNFVNNDLK